MCPACRGARLTAIKVAGLALQRCDDCGLWIAAFPHTRHTGYSAIDRRAYDGAMAALRREQSASIVALVREHVPEGEWLDVGCGFGFAVDAARDAGYAARGIEPNEIAARAARERGIDVEEGLLTDATAPADVISTLDVLEHVEEMSAFAQLVRRKARRLWVIKVPSSDGLFFRVAHALRIAPAVERLWQSRYEDPHRVYFNETALRTFLHEHGFETVATRYLRELPAHSVVDRLTMDGRMPRWKARLAVPAVAALNVVERLRARSDAMVMLARPRG